MTIVSHRHRLIFLKTRKTAGSSVEAALIAHLGFRDLVSTTEDNEPVRHSPLHTPNRVDSWVPCAARLQDWGKQRGLKSMSLYRHATAEDVRSLIGAARWDRYLKIAIERNPWDRVLSLWRWCCVKEPLPFEEFLDRIEEGEPWRVGGLKHHQLSNWPIYTIDNHIAVDVLVQYDELEPEIQNVLGQVGVRMRGPLPRVKAGLRGPEHGVDRLSQDHVERIGRLFRREVEHFRYSVPAVEPEFRRSGDTGGPGS